VVVPTRIGILNYNRTGWVTVGEGERDLDLSMCAIAKLTGRAREAAGVGSAPPPRPSRRASLWATAARTPTTSTRITPSGSVELNLQSRDDHRTGGVLNALTMN